MRADLARTGKAILRWSIVAVFGAVGLAALWSAANILWSLSSMHEGLSFFLLGFFVFALFAICAAFCLRVAWLTAARRYRSVCDLVAALAATAAFGAVLILPGDFVVDLREGALTESWLGLPVAVAVLCSPFVGVWVARWVNDRLRTLLHRFVPDDGEWPRSGKPVLGTDVDEVVTKAL